MRWSIEIAPAVLQRATDGDAEAVNHVASVLVQPIFNLAVRFLYAPQDAEDAAQEALVRVVKGLPTFQGRSAFSTWVYRVVVRSLLNARRGRREGLTIDSGVEALDAGLVEGGQSPEDPILVEEVKLSCTTVLLVCLPRTQRLAYVLGEIIGLSGPEAAAVLEITPTAYRQRLAAARKTVRGFFRSRCGLVDQSLHCRCAQQVKFCVRTGFIDPDRLRFADRKAEHRQTMRALDATFTEADVYRSHPDYPPSPELRARIRAKLVALLDGQIAS